MSEAETRDLLRTEPGKWLQQQVKVAVDLRRDGQFDQEVQLWDQTIESLSHQVGAGYWVTAGARLSREVAKQLASMSDSQLQQWKQFQDLETEISEKRVALTRQLAAGEITASQQAEQLNLLIEKADQQRAIVEGLFGHQSHLLGNISFQRAEMLADQTSAQPNSDPKRFVPALVEAERSLRLRESSIKVQHPDTLASLKLMGQLAQNSNSLELAKDCFTRAVRQAEHVWGTQHLNYADHCNDLGVFYYWALENRKNLGQTYSDAHHWLDVALHIRQNRLGDEALLTALSLRNQALLKLGEGTSKPEGYRALDYSAAETAFEQALPIFRAKATDSSMLAQVLIESATAKMLVKEFATAEDRLREVRNGELAEFNPKALSLSLFELDYRIAAACIKQDDDQDKVAQGKAMMQQLAENRIPAGSEASDIAAASKIATRASMALSKLNNTSRFSPLPATQSQSETRVSALPDTNQFK